MSIPNITAGTPIRLQVCTAGTPAPFDVNTATTPKLWRAFSSSIQIGVFDSNGAPVDLSQFNYLQLTIATSQNASANAIFKTVLAGSIIPTITKADWLAGVNQNAIFDLSAADTDVGLSAKTVASYWIQVSGVTSAGTLIVLGAGPINIWAAGSAMLTQNVAGFQAFQVSIPTNASSMAVTFPTPFNSLPASVRAIVIPPAGQGQFIGTIVSQDSLTVNGCTVYFTNSVPAGCTLAVFAAGFASAIQPITNGTQKVVSKNISAGDLAVNLQFSQSFPTTPTFVEVVLIPPSLSSAQFIGISITQDGISTASVTANFTSPIPSDGWQAVLFASQ